VTERFYRNMFLIAAIWNVGGGAVIVLLARWIFSMSGVSFPEPPAYFHSWVALFVVFGIGYYMIHRDMYANKNIVILGIIGKLGFAVVFAYNMIAYPNQIPLFFLIPMIGDLIFVGLFWAFLNFARKAGR
jgi:hypothetical protein